VKERGVRANNSGSRSKRRDLASGREGPPGRSTRLSYASDEPRQHVLARTSGSSPDFSTPATSGSTWPISVTLDSGGKLPNFSPWKNASPKSKPAASLPLNHRSQLWKPLQYVSWVDRTDTQIKLSGLVWPMKRKCCLTRTLPILNWKKTRLRCTMHRGPMGMHSLIKTIITQKTCDAASPQCSTSPFRTASAYPVRGPRSSSGP